MSAPCLESEMEGLSFAARAVLASATALTYEHQEAEIAVHILKRMLGLSDAAWGEVYAELYDAGVLFICVGPFSDIEYVQCREGDAVLAWAIGPGGRPSTREWRELRDRVLSVHGEECFYCQTEGVDLEIDHIHPVSRGGSNHYRNLVPACKSCNSSKGNKTEAAKLLGLPSRYALYRQMKKRGI